MTLRKAFEDFIKELKNARKRLKLRSSKAVTRGAFGELYKFKGKLLKKLSLCCVDKGWTKDKDCSILINFTRGKSIFKVPQVIIGAKGISKKSSKGMFIDYELKNNDTILVASIAFGYVDIIERTKSQGYKDIETVDLDLLSTFHKRIIEKLQESSNERIPPEWQHIIKEEMDDFDFGRGMLIARKYECDQLPSEKELKEDLNFLLGVYQKATNNKEGWNEYWDNNLDDVFGQLPKEGARPKKVARAASHPVQKTKDFEYSYEECNKIDAMSSDNNIQTEWTGTKEPKVIPKSSSNGRCVPTRNLKRAAGALCRAKYTCEVGGKSHKTFKRPNGTNYVEPHHLIPMSRYKDFEYNVDVLENIVSLCSHCHNLLHYGLFEKKEPVLKRLFEARKDALHKCGLDISWEKLKEYYK